MPPICRAQHGVLTANMRHEFVHYNNTNQDQQPDFFKTQGVRFNAIIIFFSP
jgi:hypothetical protein